MGQAAEHECKHLDLNSNVIDTEHDDADDQGDEWRQLWDKNMIEENATDPMEIFRIAKRHHDYVKRNENLKQVRIETSTMADLDEVGVDEGHGRGRHAAERLERQRQLVHLT